MTPFESAMQKAAASHWRENRDFHDSDGVDVEETFKAGTQAALTHLTQTGGKFGPRIADCGYVGLTRDPQHKCDKCKTYVSIDELIAARAEIERLKSLYEVKPSGAQ